MSIVINEYTAPRLKRRGVVGFKRFNFLRSGIKQQILVF